RAPGTTRCPTNAQAASATRTTASQIGRETTSERIRRADVDVPAVETEGRVARIREDAEVEVRRDVLVGEIVEEVFRAGGQRDPREPIRQLEVEDPFRAEGLVVRRVRAVDRAVRSVAAAPGGRAPIAAPPVRRQAQVVFRLSTRQPALLEPIEEDRLEGGQLRRSRGDPRDLVRGMGKGGLEDQISRRAEARAAVRGQL